MAAKKNSSKIKVYNPLSPETQILSAAQVAEFEKCAQDFEYFARTYVKVNNVDRGTVAFALRPYQSKISGIVIENRFSIFDAPRQALWIEEDIPTPTGFTKMGDLKVGDDVLGADGKPTKVTYVTEVMEGKECFKITFSTGEEIIADADHLWEVRYEDSHGGRKTKIFTTKELAKRKLTGYKNFKWYSVKTTKPLDLPYNTSLPIDPYLFGVWLGDGTASCGQITTHMDDLAHLTREVVESGNTVLSTVVYREHVCRVGIMGLHSAVRKLGVRNDKHIPQCYLRASYSQRLALLQGLMDTDGYCNLDNGACEISSSYPKLAQGIFELITSLGLKPTKVLHMTRTSKTSEYKPSERIYFTAFKQECPVFRMERKLKRMRELPFPTRIQSTKKRSIVSIIPVPSVPVRCISVSNKDSLFLVGRSFIPTHNCGKSLTVSALLLWYMIFNPGFHIGVGSNKLASAKNIVRALKFAYEEMPMWLKPAVKSYNKQDIEFDNDSSIEAAATTGDGLRSKTFNIIYLDEFAHIKQAIAQDFWTSTFPVISSGNTTKVIITSTPNGTEGLYAQLWFGAVNETNGFAHYKVDSNEIEGRDGDFRERMLKKIGLTQYMQEFEGAFVSNKGTLVASLVLEALKPKPVVCKFRDTRFFADPTGRFLIAAVDVSAGVGQDSHAIQLFDKNTLEQVGEYQNNTLNQKLFAKEIIALFEYLDDVAKVKQLYWSVENNSYGLGVINLLQTSNHRIFTRNYILPVSNTSKSFGIQMNGHSKARGCALMKELIENGRMGVSSEKLITELKFFVKHGGSFAAESGTHDDLTMGCVNICLMLEQIAHEDDRVDSVLHLGELSEDEVSTNQQVSFDDSMPIVF